MTTELERDIDCACAAMSRGGLILYPTDTVWGIGCDATNESAVAKVYALKRRDDSKALITLVGSVECVAKMCPNLSDAARDALSGIDRRPTTVILDGITSLAGNLLAPDGSAGVRVTAEIFSKSLCQRFGRPIVSTSANVSGSPTPAIFAEIAPEILRGVDYVCETRRDDNRRSAPSIVARVSADGTTTILRK